MGSKFSPAAMEEGSQCWQSHDHRDRRPASFPFLGPHLAVGGKQEDARRPAMSPLGPLAREALAPAPQPAPSRWGLASSHSHWLPQGTQLPRHLQHSRQPWALCPQRVALASLARAGGGVAGTRPAALSRWLGGSGEPGWWTQSGAMKLWTGQARQCPLGRDCTRRGTEGSAG